MSDAIVPVHRLISSRRSRLTGPTSSRPSRVLRDGRQAELDAFQRLDPDPLLQQGHVPEGRASDTPPVTWSDVEAASRKILAAGAAKCGFTTPSPSWTLLENTFAWHDQPFATNQNGYAGLDTKLLINSDFGLMHVGALVRWQKENIFVYGGPEGRAMPGSPMAIAPWSCSRRDSSGIQAIAQVRLGTGQLPIGTTLPEGEHDPWRATLWVMRGHPPAPTRRRAVPEVHHRCAQQRWWTAARATCRDQVRHQGQEDDDFYKRNPEQWTAVSQLLNAKPRRTARACASATTSRFGIPPSNSRWRASSPQEDRQGRLDAAVNRATRFCGSSRSPMAPRPQGRSDRQ